MIFLQLITVSNKHLLYHENSNIHFNSKDEIYLIFPDFDKHEHCDIKESIWKPLISPSWIFTTLQLCHLSLYGKISRQNRWF